MKIDRPLGLFAASNITWKPNDRTATTTNIKTKNMGRKVPYSFKKKNLVKNCHKSEIIDGVLGITWTT